MKPSSLPPLHIMAFMDGRPGHEKQTLGIVGALNRRTPVETTYQRVTAGDRIASIKNWMAYLGLKLVPIPSHRPPGLIDLIIGTGAYTHIPMLRLKRTCGAKTVTCMTPAQPLIRDFDLCFIPHHDRIDPDKNIFTTIGPPNNAVFQGNHQSDRGLILVGGVDPKSHFWKTERLMDQVRQIVATAPSVEWTISSSPRTPAETIQQLDGFASQTPNARFYRSEDTPSGWIEEQYAVNHSVWVSADSISMVYEALTAGCRVGILSVDWKQRESKFKKSLDYLCAKGWVTSFEDRETGSDPAVGKNRLDEAGRCAEEILNRWWPNRLK